MMKKNRKIKGLATDSIFLAFAKLMTTVISLAVSKILAIKFSLFEYGVYSQIMLIASTATSFSILGLSDGVNYYYNNCFDLEQKKKNINTIFFMQTVAGSICAVLILCFSNSITNYFKNPDLNGLYVYIAFMPIISNFLAMYQVLFVSVGKAKGIAIKNLIVSLIKLGIITTVAFSINNISIIVIASLITDVLQLFYFAISFGISNFYVNPCAVDWKLIGKILGYCLPLSFYILTSSLCRDIDKYVISFFADTETLSVYTNAAKVLPFDMLASSLTVVMVPIVVKYITNNEYEKTKDIFRTYLSISYKTTWLVTFGVIICAKELMLFLYDEKYLAGLGVFIIYIVVDMIRFANLSIILRAKNKTLQLALYSVGMLISNFVLNIILFKLCGIIGPAIATLVVTLGTNILMMVHAGKIIKAKISQLLDFKDMLITICSMIFGGGIAMLIKLLCNAGSLHYLLTLIFSYGGYAIIVLLFNYKKIIQLLKHLNSFNINE